MADHPMSCYPGHFEPWRRGRFSNIGFPSIREITIGYDGAQRLGVSADDVIKATDKTIYRMMGKMEDL